MLPPQELVVGLAISKVPTQNKKHTVLFLTKRFLKFFNVATFLILLQGTQVINKVQGYRKSNLFNTKE